MNMAELLYKEESYKIIGLCMDIHNELGKGFKEAVYKEALQFELLNEAIKYEREKKFEIYYKGILLKQKYIADFIVFDNILLEIKATPIIINAFVAQTINYLKASGIRLGIIINFGEASLNYKRIVF